REHARRAAPRRGASARGAHPARPPRIGRRRGGARRAVDPGPPRRGYRDHRQRRPARARDERGELRGALMAPRFFAPEAIQTSLMDCGPAAIKAALQGFGIEVHYDALRDRCATDVDGTCIDALAGLADELGLQATEMVVPHDSFLLEEAACLPAIVVVRA